MSRTYLAAKINERQSITTTIKGLYEKAAAAGRELTDTEQTQRDEMESRAAVLDAEIGRVNEFASSSQSFMQLVGGMREREEDAERVAAEQAERGSTPQPERAASFGARLIESAAFTDYRGRGSMEPVTFDNYVETAAPIMLPDLNLAPMTWVGPRQPTFVTPLLGVCGRVQTNNNAIQYVVWGSPSDAEIVPEGEVKPEATFEPTPHTAELVTIAHWRAITRQAIEDLPQIRSLVDGHLRRGVAQKLEAEATAALTTSTDVPVVAGPGLLEAIRIGIGSIQAQGYTPDALVLNPADFADLDLDVMAATQNGPTRSQSFWGLTPVPSNSVPAGEAYVGEFGTGLTWYDRGSTEVLITDSHADYFVRNMLVILAETRAAFAVTEPRALAKVSAGS